MTAENKEKSSGYFHLNGKKHDLAPQGVKRAINLPYDGDIDKWPAHATNRLFSSLTTSNNTRMKVTTVKDINPTFDHTKPKFLIYLETYIRREMAYRSVAAEGVSVDRLQIYREVFDYIIEAFHSYGPILASIKREYDMIIAFYVENIRILEPMKSKLYLFSMECDRKILQARENEKKDNSKLMEKNKELKNEISDLQHENDELRHKIERITLVTEEEHQKYRDERDAKMVLLLNKQNEEQKSVQPDKGEYYAYREEAENLKISLFEAKKAHSDLLQLKMSMEVDYAEVVPKIDYVKIKDANTELTAEVKRLGKALAEADNEKKETYALYDMAVEQRDNYYLKLMHAISGQTPDWIICAEFLAEMLDKWNKPDIPRKYDELIEIVVRDIVTATNKDESDDESEEKRYVRATENLDADGWRSARLLGEIIADRIHDQNASKSATKRSMSKIFEKFERVLTRELSTEQKQNLFN